MYCPHINGQICTPCQERAEAIDLLANLLQFVDLGKVRERRVKSFLKRMGR